MLLHNHQLNKPLNGPNGYKRLVRLVARTFYSGELPPKGQEEEQQPPGNRSRLPKHFFPGLGVLLVDVLSSEDGYMVEDDICRKLRLSKKYVTKALRYLETQHVLSSQAVKFKNARVRPGEANGTAAAKQKSKRPPQESAQLEPQAPVPQQPQQKPKPAKPAAVEDEEDQQYSKETRVYWCVDYPGLKDSLRLRLHRVREHIKEQAQDTNPLQDYLCPTCGANYSSLDAIRLLDPLSGTFRCEDCRGELVQHVEGGTAVGEGEAGRKAYAKMFKEMGVQLEAQLRPISEQLERVKDTDPPDVGSVQDWAAETRAAQQRKEKREASAAARAAAAAAAGEEPPQEWLENAEVQVNFGAARVAATVAAEPGKELPAWFRQPQASGLASNTTTSDATAEPSAAAGSDAAAAAAAAAHAEDEERQRRIQEAYLQQYLADMARAKAAVAAGASDAYEDKKDVKRVKTESGWAAAEVKPEPEPKAEPAAAAAGPEVGGWHQVEQAQQEQQQQQQQQAEDDFGDWEDVAAKEEAGGGGLAAAAVDDDFEWEDA